MLLTARTAIFIAKSLGACRERLLKQQYLHGSLFVQGNLQGETRKLGKTVHTASQQVYANEHDEEKDCSFYRGKCHERVKVSSRIYAQSRGSPLGDFHAQRGFHADIAA